MAQPPGAAASNPSAPSANANATSNGVASNKDLPRDARIIALILASMGASDAEPAVVAMLLEFAHRYTQDILTSALVYAEHAGRPRDNSSIAAGAGSTTASGAGGSGGSKDAGLSANLPMIELDDLRLAVSSKLEHSYSSPFPKEFLMPLAAQINRIPLPIVPESYGIRLPPERERLTAVNWDFNPVKERRTYHDVLQNEQSLQQSTSAVPGDSMMGLTNGMDVDLAANNDLFGNQDDDEDEDAEEDEDDEDMEEVVDDAGTAVATQSVNGEEDDEDDDDDDDAEADAEADADDREEDDDYDG